MVIIKNWQEESVRFDAQAYGWEAEYSEELGKIKIIQEELKYSTRQKRTQTNALVPEYLHLQLHDFCVDFSSHMKIVASNLVRERLFDNLNHLQLCEIDYQNWKQVGVLLTHQERRAVNIIRKIFRRQMDRSVSMREVVTWLLVYHLDQLHIDPEEHTMTYAQIDERMMSK